MSGLLCSLPSVPPTPFGGEEESFAVGEDSFAGEEDSFGGEEESFVVGEDTFAGEQDAFTGEEDSFAGEQDAFAVGEDTLAEAYRSLIYMWHKIIKNKIAFEAIYLPVYICRFLHSTESH